jgi:Xaa-Pro aminopeptidase
VPATKLPNPFSREEYLGRLRRCREAMTAVDAHCFVVTDASNICYLTGYGADSSYIMQALVIHADAELPTLYLRRQDSPAGRQMAWLPDEHVVGYPESFIGDDRIDGFDYLFDRLASQRGLERVGLEFGAISGATLEKLRARYGRLALVDLSDTIERLRLTKSPAEIAVMREASEITDLAMARAAEVVRPGRRECDAAAEITAALIRGTKRYGGERFGGILMPGGAQTGTSHINWTDQPIERGKHYNLEFGGFRFRYAVALMRSLAVGTPSQKLSRLYGYMIEGCNTALAAVKPGVTLGAIATAYCEVVKKGGYIKDSRCGYPIGIDWLETSCSLRTDDLTVVAPNMVFHLMLGMWLEEDFGAVISETFVVTLTGHEVFSRYPRELIVV